MAQSLSPGKGGASPMHTMFYPVTLDAPHQQVCQTHRSSLPIAPAELAAARGGFGPSPESLR